MTHPTIQVDYDQLADIARRFEGQAGASRQMHQRLQRGVTGLQNGGWAGVAAEAFYGEMDAEIFPALARLEAALAQAAAVSRQIRDVMQQAEEEAAAPFRGAARGEAAGGGATSDSASAGGGVAGPKAIPPPRIYIVNGINSAGNILARDENKNIIYGDDQSVALEKLLEKYGYDPDQVKSTEAIFNQPVGQGSDSGWLKNLMGKAANYTYGTLEVMAEYFLGERGYYTNRVYEEIAQDLRSNPLAPDQTIILMGHSGGGAVTANLAGMLERNLGQDVSGMVTMGSPVSNYDEAGRYAELIVDVRHAGDRVAAPFGTPVIRSEESRTSIPRTLLSLAAGAAVVPALADAVVTEAIGRVSGAAPNVKNVILKRSPGDHTDPHGSYMHDDTGDAANVSTDMLNALKHLVPNFKMDPVTSNT